MSFEVGRTYGDYEFLDVIRMSRTEIAYRVRNRMAQRFETLRVLPGQLQNDQQQMERFLREMRVHARLSHPHIVAFYHAGELDRHVIMTTEYVEGVTLRDRLSLGPMPWQTAVDYMRQALSALACAHAQQIVHRDVTPENMIITPEATLKLNGFGLAKGASSPQLTQLGAVVGSPKYTSPEQIKGSSKIDGRSDLYSLGAVLYEAIAGRPPFSFSSQFELMLAQVSQTPEPPSRANFLVPPALDAVVLRALEKDPGRRFQTAEEFGAALENVKLALERPSAGEGAVAVSVEAAARPAELSAGPAISPAPRPSGPATVAPPVTAPAEVVAPVAEAPTVVAPAEVVAPAAEALPVAVPAEVVAPVAEAPAVAAPAEGVAPVAEAPAVAVPAEVVAPVAEAAPVTAPAEVVAPVAEAPRDWESVPLFQNISPPGLGWRDFAIAALVLCGIVGVALFITLISSK